MISSYSITTNMTATYDFQGCVWVGSGEVNIEKKELGDAPISEKYVTEELIAVDSDTLFTDIADAVEKLIATSNALDEDDLTDIP